MDSKTFILASFIAISCVFMQCHGLLGGSDPVEANPEEMQLCVGSAGNKTVQSATKETRLACKVTCLYDDNSTIVVNSPERQLCSDSLRIVPTGRCSEGSCATGRILF